MLGKPGIAPHGFSYVMRCAVYSSTGSPAALQSNIPPG
jgi:hypothetical protein